MSEIKIDLFSLIDEIDPIVDGVINIPSSKTQSEPSEILKLVKVRDSLTTFARNFLMQFFHASGFAIVGFRPDVLSSMKEKRKWKRKPETMIQLMEDYLRIDNDVGGDPYARGSEDLRELYCVFLPKMFVAFTSEGAGLIDNYYEVARKSESVLTSIRSKCPRVKD
jgi:hypothetical protein